MVGEVGAIDAWPVISEKLEKTFWSSYTKLTSFVVSKFVISIHKTYTTFQALVGLVSITNVMSVGHKMGSRDPHLGTVLIHFTCIKLLWLIPIFQKFDYSVTFKCTYS